MTLFLVAVISSVRDCGCRQPWFCRCNGAGAEHVTVMMLGAESLDESMPESALDVAGARLAALPCVGSVRSRAELPR